MSAYENGCNTRKTILDACFGLFLEKGFHGTSYDDICREAHVNRGSIYYHFKEKNNIRYEVHWELLARNRTFIEAFCPGTRHGFMLSIYVLWAQFLKDVRIRNFILDYFRDQPIYSPSSELGRFYYMAYGHMYGDLWPMERIDKLDFASVYGHLHAVMLLAGENPDQYDPDTMLRHCIYAGTSVWGIPKEKIDGLWADLEMELQQISMKEIPLF